MAYGLSAYGTRQKKNTTHENWCDLMVARASASRKIYSVKKPVSTGTKSFNYSNGELKELFKNLLTAQ